METYISILRGINVSGKNLIKMDALRQSFIDFGFQNVQSYIQSGNIIFQDKITDTKELEKRITNLIFEKFTFKVPVFVIEIENLKAIVENNPFQNDKSKDKSFLHITFLSEVPAKENFEKIIPGQYQQDEFVLKDKAIYLYCPNGYGISKLNNTFFENKLKLSATTRNWRTSNELLVIAQKIQQG